MSTALQSLTDRAERIENSDIEITGLGVNDSGRVSIPARFLDRHDLGEDEVVDVHFDTGVSAFWALDLVMDDRGRLRIPSEKRDLYGVEDGDVVDVTLAPRGITEGDL